MIHTIRVSRTIDAPIDEVFDAYTDHAALAQVPGVRSARVTKPGGLEPNGLGAVREVDTGFVWLREEITAFDRPHRMEYRIRESRPRSDHRLGRVEFEETARGTKITWTSVFNLRIPVVGRVVGRALATGFGIGFRVVLASLARRMRASSPQTAEAR